jgi:hypothetical protein
LALRPQLRLFFRPRDHLLPRLPFFRLLVLLRVALAVKILFGSNVHMSNLLQNNSLRV